MLLLSLASIAYSWCLLWNEKANAQYVNPSSHGTLLAGELHSITETGGILHDY